MAAIAVDGLPPPVDADPPPFKRHATAAAPAKPRQGGVDQAGLYRLYDRNQVPVEVQTYLLSHFELPELLMQIGVSARAVATRAPRFVPRVGKTAAATEYNRGRMAEKVRWARAHTAGTWVLAVISLDRRVGHRGPVRVARLLQDAAERYQRPEGLARVQSRQPETWSTTVAGVAGLYGNISALSWLADQPYIMRFNDLDFHPLHFAMAWAAFGGHGDAVRWVAERLQMWDIEVVYSMEAAAAADRVDMLVLLTEIFYLEKADTHRRYTRNTMDELKKLYKLALDAAATGGNMRVLKWLTRGVPENVRVDDLGTAFVNAAAAGYMASVDFLFSLLLDSGQPQHILIQYVTGAALRAAMAGKLETLKWLHARGASTDATMRLIFNGITSVDTLSTEAVRDVIRYLVQMRAPVLRTAIGNLAAKGDLPALQLVFAEADWADPAEPYARAICLNHAFEKATIHGRFRVMYYLRDLAARYIREKPLPFSVDDADILSAAALQQAAHLADATARDDTLSDNARARALLGVAWVRHYKGINPPGEVLDEDIQVLREYTDLLEQADQEHDVAGAFQAGLNAARVARLAAEAAAEEGGEEAEGGGGEAEEDEGGGGEAEDGGALAEEYAEEDAEEAFEAAVKQAHDEAETATLAAEKAAEDLPPVDDSDAAEQARKDDDIGPFAAETWKAHKRAGSRGIKSGIAPAARGSRGRVQLASAHPRCIGCASSTVTGHCVNCRKAMCGAVCVRGHVCVPFC
jgi:hypothetical protein